MELSAPQTPALACARLRLPRLVHRFLFNFGIRKVKNLRVQSVGVIEKYGLLDLLEQGPFLFFFISKRPHHKGPVACLFSWVLCFLKQTSFKNQANLVVLEGIFFQKKSRA